MTVNLTSEEVDALRHYADRYGRTWKSVMRGHWNDAAGGPVVQRLRNELGLKWLKNFRLPPPAPPAPPVLATQAYMAYVPQQCGRNLDITA